jgi:hypothetical protein
MHSPELRAGFIIRVCMPASVSVCRTSLKVNTPKPYGNYASIILVVGTTTVKQRTFRRHLRKLRGIADSMYPAFMRLNEKVIKLPSRKSTGFRLPRDG